MKCKGDNFNKKIHKVAVIAKVFVVTKFNNIASIKLYVFTY